LTPAGQLTDPGLARHITELLSELAEHATRRQARAGITGETEATTTRSPPRRAAARGAGAPRPTRAEAARCRTPSGPPGMTQPHRPAPCPEPPTTPPTITQEVTSLTGTGPIHQQTGLRPETTRPRTVWRAGLAAAGIAAAANLAVFALAQAAGTQFRVHFPAHQAA